MGVLVGEIVGVLVKRIEGVLVWEVVGVIVRKIVGVIVGLSLNVELLRHEDSNLNTLINSQML